MIRNASPSDAQIILDLIIELADYEKAVDEVTATIEDIRASFFGDNPKVFAEIIEIQEEDGTKIVAGFAVWFLNYSTWQGKHGVYLEDLFVRERFRGRGLGKMALQYLANICLSRGYGRFQWWVLDWNQPSIEFYRALGAKPMDEWTVFRVDGQALTILGQ